MRRLLPLLLLCVSASACASTPIYRQFKDWVVACDNTARCEARGANGISPLMLRLIAEAGPAGALSLVALRHLTAYGVQLVTNLEPIYAIVLAILLLGEQREQTPLFYLGVAIILAAVFLHPLLERRKATGAVHHPEVLGTSEAKNLVD